ncbi:MAG TPA: hypothetical protein VHI13_07640 [Candidatus Kapabacteria bacterium]|nr:hypothetical protein [Candidatus Kapabacteria bacterium]
MAVSFEKDIKPYFTSKDRDHMNSTDYVGEPFDLWSASVVREKFDGIRHVIESGRMPPGPEEGGDGPWPQEKVELFLSLFDGWKSGGWQP